MVAEGAAAAADLVAVIAARGVAAADVVLGGGVATNVPEVARAVTDRLATVVSAARVPLLDVPPVVGATELARRVAAARRRT